MRPALLAALALAASGCAHRPPAVPCAAANLPFVARAMPDILALADPPPATLEAGFVLCSREEARLLVASAALGEKGYSSYIGAGDGRGKCLRVVRTHEASVAALEREVATMCEIAEVHGIAYRHWQTEVGDKSVRLAGERLTIAGKARRLD
ncbi:MAG TPA: hypothetical protein VE053_07455 [Allosphingosinicella sp.]|nr:hypothetical protein [Allosphingosinicella sp.]